MLFNYFKTAFRNIRANRLFTMLNVAGLSIGLSVCILLFAYIFYQLSFDNMFKNSKDIYRVNLQMGDALQDKKFASTPNAVAPAISQSIPQILAATRLVKANFGLTATLKTGEHNFVEKGLYLADSTLFNIFDFNFLEGKSNEVFKQPKSIVLSLAAKERLFGNSPAMGRLIYVNSRDTLVVTGVYENLAKNSSIDCDLVANIKDSWMGKQPWWSNASYETYCLLQPNAKLAEVEKLATAILIKNVGKDTFYFKSLFFQPLIKIHLYSEGLSNSYISNYGNINSVRSLIFLSLLILFTACINYMNLATAQTRKRAKAIGVNKVLGASKRHMAMLLYSETAMLSFIAVVIGYSMAYCCIPLFQKLTGTAIAYGALLSSPILAGLLFIWLVVTLLAGSYPAISISRISPLSLINNEKQKNALADLIRQTLVVFQFAASVVLIISFIIIMQQVKFMGEKNIGYNPRGVVSLPIGFAQNPEDIAHTMTEIKNISGVEAVSAMQTIPGEMESGKSVSKSSSDETGLPAWTCRTDGSIVSTLQLHLLAGTTLPPYLGKDDKNCYALINEVIAKYLGFKTPADAVGKYIITEMSKHTLVKGVVENFNFRSLKEEIGGYVYYESNDGEPKSNIVVRYNAGNLPNLMEQLQLTLRKDLPNAAFDYEFLDKHVQDLYITEQQSASTASVFSLLAIFIACLGLFGLVSYTAEQRTKEIGIRKVLGASVSGVTTLLLKDFLKLVIVAFVVASPIAWLLMNKWLQEFAYRINISWWVFLIAGITAMLIALLTVSFQSIKAALANPVKVLRSI